MDGVHLSRRGFLETSAAAVAGLSLTQDSRPAPRSRLAAAPLSPFASAALPAGIRSRFIEHVNGLTVHILEAGYETAGRPAVLLMHGFPELA